MLYLNDISDTKLPINAPTATLAYSMVLFSNHKTNKGLDAHLNPCFNWWPLCESNTVPTDYESAALTKHELRGQKPFC